MPRSSKGNFFKHLQKEKHVSIEKISIYRANWVRGEWTRARKHSVNTYSVEDDILTKYSWKVHHQNIIPVIWGAWHFTSLSPQSFQLLNKVTCRHDRVSEALSRYGTKNYLPGTNWQLQLRTIYTNIIYIDYRLCEEYRFLFSLGQHVKILFRITNFAVVV